MIRRRLIVALAVLGAAVPFGSRVPALSAQAVAPCVSGLTTVRVPVPSTVHVWDNRVNVLLPPDYCASKTRFPVLYLLHGAGDTYSTWSKRTDLVSFARAFRLIIVMPDAGHNSHAGWYSNWADGEYQWETFDSTLLPAFVNSHFRTLPRDAGIAGLSMGGFGAMSLAARHPGTYKIAASFSGAVDMLIASPLTGPLFTLLHNANGTPDDRVWGNQFTNRAVWAAHNPTSLASHLAGTKVLLASGTGTPLGPEGDEVTNPAGYVLEGGIFQMNLSFARALNAAGVRHTDHFYLGGLHSWPYWQADLHWALPQIAATLNRAAGS